MRQRRFLNGFVFQHADRDKGKAVPLQPWTGPEGSRGLRRQDFKTIGTWKLYVCQPYAGPPLPHSKYS
jgi:hypothetical protein